MPTLREVMRSTSGGGRLNAILAALAFSEKMIFSLERLQHTSDLDFHLLMKLSWPISCELTLTLQVKGDHGAR